MSPESSRVEASGTERPTHPSSPTGTGSPARRKGDSIEIPGDYQARALREGFVAQRAWHTLKFRLIKRELPPLDGQRLLDVGCGSGVIADWLAGLARRVDAVDGNPRAIEYARSTAAHPNVVFHLGLVDELEFDEGSFDQVYCMELIEHLHEPQVLTMLSSLLRLLRPGGRALLTTPNYRSAWPLLEWFMDAARLVPRLKDEQHVTKFTRSKLVRICREAGFECERVGRFSGLAPFVSVVSWRLFEALDRAESRCGSPFGLVLFAVLRRPA